MIQRCTNEKHPAYDRYGGRGITVCNEWLESFDAFFIDMGDRPKGVEIDRIDNNLGYFKDNCRWDSRANNNRNTKTSKRWIIKGVEYSSGSIAAKALGVGRNTITKWCRERDDCHSESLYP